MRIIAGKWRGRALKAPAGTATRPTSERAREALFSMLASRVGSFEGLRVCDLFAGTGALGLEALSRGAAWATFVEMGRPALALLAANIGKFRAGADTEVIAADATRLGRRAVAPFDLVFLDPPYGRGLGEQALAAAQAGGWLAPGALVAWEEGGPVRPPAGFVPLDVRRYGAATLTLLRHGA